MRTIALALLLVAAACKDRPAPAAEPPAGGSPAAVKKPARPDLAAEAKDANKAAAEFLARWTATQQKLDFDAYVALYHARTFRGVKRTAAGKVTELDLAGWKSDRRRMFQKKFEIATEPLGIETWLDPGSKLKQGMVVIRFTQRWRSGTYADHGVKVLHVWSDPKGAMKITYEDLLNSEPGWDRFAADVPAADLAPPADPAAALALWKKLAPTAADYHEKLASIPDDPAVARPMAVALLAGGHFACEEVLEYDECGVTSREWKDLDPRAGFDDPCVRRRLALWALEKIHPADTPPLEGVLHAVARLEPPENELPQAALAAVSGAPEAVRLSVWGALVQSGREELIVVDHDISEKGLIAAADLGIAAAALDLDPIRHMEKLVELVGDESMADATRASMLDKLVEHQHPTITRALVALAAGEKNCSLAMSAALALARQGDASHLPRRRADMDGERALCMLMHDPDPARQKARVTEFILKEGIPVKETVEDPWAAAMAAEDAGPDAPPAEEDEPHSVADVDAVIDRLNEIFDGTAGWETATVNVGSDDGGPVIESFQYYRYNGCGC